MVVSSIEKNFDFKFKFEWLKKGQKGFKKVQGTQKCTNVRVIYSTIKIIIFN